MSEFSKLGEKLLDEFKTNIKGAKLTAKEQGLAKRAAEDLAMVAVLTLNGTPQDMAGLLQVRNLAYATLANIAAIKSGQAEKAMDDAIRTTFEIAIKLLIKGLLV